MTARDRRANSDAEHLALLDQVGLDPTSAGEPIAEVAETDHVLLVGPRGASRLLAAEVGRQVEAELTQPQRGQQRHLVRRDPTGLGVRRQADGSAPGPRAGGTRPRARSPAPNVGTMIST